MKAIICGAVVTPWGVLPGKALLFDEKIRGIVDESEVKADEIIDAKSGIVCPGLVDVHIHGYLGEDISDGKEDGLRKMAKGVLENGVTSFLPTTMTVPWDELETAFALVRRVMPESLNADFDGAEILGVHAEGPFINPDKKGAQSGEAILPPDADKVKPWLDVIRMITMAPEMPGGYEAIKALSPFLTVSVGHTNAGYDEAVKAFGCGANHITHLFNAMSGLHHRNPGMVGAALTNPVYAELIADTFHVNKGLFPLLAKAKGDHLVLITDCTRAGGLEDGVYTLGGQDIFVKGIECRLKDGTIAGSVLKLNNAVRNMAIYGGVQLFEAVNMASLYAARSIGVADTKGSLEKGKDADIMIMDGDFTVRKTFVRGELKFERK